MRRVFCGRAIAAVSKLKFTFFYSLACCVLLLCRHIMTELIETERLYVEELQSIMEVQYVIEFSFVLLVR